MWRDRTNLYISYRQSYAHHPLKRKHDSGPYLGHGSGVLTGRHDSDDRQGLLSPVAFEDDGDAVIELDLLPPRWADITDEITDLLADVSNKSQTLDRLHQKHVLPVFNDDESKRAEEGEIERLTQDITRSFHECQSHIQRVDGMVREAKQRGHINVTEEAMAKNIQVALAAKVQETSAAFRKKQSAYLKRLRDSAGLGVTDPIGDRASTPLHGSFVNPPLYESDADKSYSQSTLQATSHQRLLHSNDRIIARREREISDIAQGIIDLSNLFRDLQTMVIDQGTLLDRIDYNVESMTAEVKGAEKELNRATGYQKQSTKRKLILLLILIIGGFIILLIVKPKRQGTDINPESEHPVRL